MFEMKSIQPDARIPASVLYDNRLTPNEKVLYGELTTKCDRQGCCYEENNHFAKMFDISIRSVSRAFSHLKELGYIDIELIRNERKEIKQRKIFIRAGPVPLRQNWQYPHDTDGVDNYIDNNMIDRFYLCIIENKKDEKFDKEKIVKILEHFDFLYTKDLLDNFSEENKIRIKTIMFSIYILSEKTSLFYIERLTREKIVFIYDKCYARRDEIINFTSYFITALENEITRF